jgi:hypothetical protein
MRNVHCWFIGGTQGSSPGAEERLIASRGAEDRPVWGNSPRIRLSHLSKSHYPTIWWLYSEIWMDSEGFLAIEWLPQQIATIVQILTIRRQETQSELPILEAHDLNIINIFCNALTYKRRGDEVWTSTTGVRVKHVNVMWQWRVALRAR